jgi:hypothetical protein
MKEAAMTLPALPNWEPTAHQLHKAAQLLGTLRLLCLKHVPNYLELAMKIVPEGLSTDVLPGGSEVVLDFHKVAMLIKSPAAEDHIIPLAGHNQATLFAALVEALQTSELASLLDSTSEGSIIDRLFSAIQAGSFAVTPKREDLTDTQSFEIDPKLSSTYGSALYAVFTGVARFRARLAGMMTPVVVWPEHFDLSFLWFAGEQPDDYKPHLNFGFAPFSPGFPLPYLYTTAYPLPTGYQGPILPNYATWNTAGWNGVVVPYDTIAQAVDRVSFVEDACLTIYKALLPVVRPDQA